MSPIAPNRPPRVPRQRRRGRRPLALGFEIPFGPRPAPRRHRRAGNHCLDRDRARRHRDRPHRPLGDGPGQLHRPADAGRRGARMRLEQGEGGVRSPRTRTSGATASGATCRPAAAASIRASQELSAQGRRDRARDADRRRGREVERRRLRMPRRQQRHHPLADRTHRDLRRGRRSGRAGAGAEGRQAQGPQGLDAARQAAASGSTSPTRSRASRSTAIDVRVPGHAARRARRSARCSGAR